MMKETIVKERKMKKKRREAHPQNPIKHKEIKKDIKKGKRNFISLIFMTSYHCE